MLFIEIDMKPAASGSGRLVCRDIDQPSAYAMPLNSCAHYGVDDERMNGTVPGHVDEADQLAPLPGRHPAEAVRLHFPDPVDSKDWVREGFGVQGVQFLVRELTAPLKTVGIHEDRVVASPCAINPSAGRDARPADAYWTDLRKHRRRSEAVCLWGRTGRGAGAAERTASAQCGAGSARRGFSLDGSA